MPRQLTPKEVLEFYRRKGLPEDFCPVPFSTLIFEANGNVCMCRRKGSEFAVGDIRKNTFQEIWNGDRLKGIREEFLTGRLKTCAEEVRRDRCNLAADNADFLDSIEFKAEQSKPPMRITPNFNGRCNLECAMCHIWQFPDGIYDKIGFWSSLERDLLPHLREIDTFSGEPFIQRDTYRLIELASKVNPHIAWSFTTNANWRLNDFIRRHLDLVHIKTFSLSIDSLDPNTYSQIRRNGSLAKAMKTFDLLQEYEQTRIARGMSPLGITIHSVIQRSNWHEIPHILALRRERKVKVHLKFLFEPPELSLLGLSASEKLRILRSLLDALPGQELMMASPIFRVLLQGVKPIERAAFIVSFKEKTGLLA